ncbi:MAG: putative signal transducing protein [Syntrophobacteraceae bacterium]
MHKVYRSPERATVYHIKNILENQGIECSVLGEHRGVAVGGIVPLYA